MAAAAERDAGLGGERRIGGDPVLVLRRLQVVNPESQNRSVVGPAGQVREVAGPPGRLGLGLLSTSASATCVVSARCGGVGRLGSSEPGNQPGRPEQRRKQQTDGAASGGSLVEVRGVAERAVLAVVRGELAGIERGRAEVAALVDGVEVQIERGPAVLQQPRRGEPHDPLQGLEARIGRLEPRRMPSTVRNPPHAMMLASPRPVEPAAPTSLSVYWPAPTIGESPARPGIFQASPLVVVTEEISPCALTTSRLIVPVGRATIGSSSGTLSQSSSGPRLARQASQSCRDSGVSRSSSLKP